MNPKTYRFGEFQLEEERRRLLRNSEPVTLPSRSFDLLVYLVENAGKLISRDDLWKTVWGENSNTNEEVLTDAMSKLRGALKDDKKPYKIIETVHRKGYQFIASAQTAPFEQTEEIFDEEAKSEEISSAAAEEKKTTENTLVEEIRNPGSQSEAILTLSDQPEAEIELDNAGEENPDNEELKSEPPTFEAWFGKSGIKWWFAVIVLATAALSIFYKDSNQATLFGSVSHLFLVLISLAYYYSFLQVKEFRPFTDDLHTKDLLKEPVKKATKHEEVSEWSETRENAKDALGYITTCWQILLVVWLALYGLLAYLACVNLDESHILKQTITSEASLHILKQTITIANNCNTLMLILCFSAFNRLEKIEKGSKWNLKDKNWLFGIVVIVLLAIVEAVCIDKYAGIGQRLGKTDLKVEDVLWFFRVVSGLSGAIAMALFVGRLQSKFFNPPAKLIAALYSYTAIQPLFVFFDDESNSMPFITAIVIHIALILKGILFLYLFWAFETGRLLFYLVRVRLTNKEVEKEWQDFQTVLEKNVP